MENFDTARLMYLGVLLLVLSGWVFAKYRGRIAQALQQLILWLFLFAGAVLLYGFKDELKHQILPAQPTVLEGGKIALARAGDQHFYASLKINGQDVVFLVDTGATDMVLSTKDATNVGIDVTGLRYLGFAHTANGEVKTARIKLDMVEFAGTTDRNVTAWVNDGEMETSLLGMAYLRRFNSIEITGNTMFLTR